MYYIRKIQGDKYSITDTKDNVREIYTKSEVKKFLDMGVDIAGSRYIFRTEAELKSLLAKLCLVCPDVLDLCIEDDLICAKFKANTGVREVRVPNGVNCINYDVPHGVEDVKLPSSVEYIAPRVFKSVHNVHLPKSNYSMGFEVFSGNTYIESLDLSGAYSLGTCLCQCCDSLVEVKLGNNLREIPYGCFNYCTSLERVSIPNGVVRIGVNAFNNVKKKHFFLPSSVRQFYTNSFPYGAEIWLESSTKILISGEDRNYIYHRYRSENEGKARKHYEETTKG